MLRQLLSGPTASDGSEAAGNLAMLSNVSATTLPFTTSSVSGTSELFSSTFAMLESDGIADTWEKPRVYDNGVEDFARFGADFGHPFDQANRVPLIYQGQQMPVHAPIMSYGMPLIAAPAAAAASAAAAAAAASSTAGPMYQMGLQQSAPTPLRPMQQAAFHPHTLAAPMPIAPQSAPVPVISGSPDDGRPQPVSTSSSTHQQQRQLQQQPRAAAATPPRATPPQAAAAAAQPSILCECCRGVYPSRRSLLGHIGRNEKCRTFVESMGAPKGAAPPSNMAAASSDTVIPGAGSPPKPGMVSSTGEGGLSPICPYCERFISHYKGNIRRHINQCCKNGGKRLKTPKNPMCGGTSSTSGKRRKFAAGSDGTPAGEGWQGPGGDMTLYEHINTSYVPAPQPPQPMQPPQQQQQSSNPLYDLPPSTNSAEAIHHPDSTTPQKKTSEADVPDDPYLCPFCDFLTVYKGNMKRHLNTCHPAEMEKGDKRLDDMRASVQGVANDELNAKLNAHKMNSTRGRKPKVGKLGMDTSGSGLSPSGADHSLGSGGSSTTSPMSTTDPYYRPPVSAHMMPGAPPMMTYAPMGYPQAPQHLLMVASGAPPPGYGYHQVQQMQPMQQPYLQQAPPQQQVQQQQSMHPTASSMMTSSDGSNTTSMDNGVKKEEPKSDDESDFDDEEEDSEDDETSKDAS